MAFYDYDKDEWSDWEDGDNTFVININDNGDIAHFLPSGKVLPIKRYRKEEENYERRQALSDNKGIR
jgi:hypothetical protein